MMKKIAIVNGGEVLETLIGFFKNSDIEITAVSEADDTILKSNRFDLIVINGSVQKFDKNIFKENTVIRLQPSLLPSFDINEPVKSAFLAGVKVGGVTVCTLDKDGRNEKILAQFPVLIDYDTHFDEFEENMLKTEKMFYPVVIKSILENKPFTFSCVMGGGCSGSCSTCKN